MFIQRHATSTSTSQSLAATAPSDLDFGMIREGDPEPDYQAFSSSFIGGSLHRVSGLSDELVNQLPSSSTRQMAIKIAVPLLAVFSIMVILMGVSKVLYLKRRRLHDIHELPIKISKSQETHQEFDPTAASNVSELKQTCSDAEPGKKSWARQSWSSMKRFSLQNRAPPGLVVGFLGSPAWETSVHQQIGDHRRRQSSSAQSRSHRHTWHIENSGTIGSRRSFLPEWTPTPTSQNSRSQRWSASPTAGNFHRRRSLAGALGRFRSDAETFIGDISPNFGTSISESLGDYLSSSTLR